VSRTEDGRHPYKQFEQDRQRNPVDEGDEKPSPYSAHKQEPFRVHIFTPSITGDFPQANGLLPPVRQIALLRSFAQNATL
jgi:hypothetical protein